MSTTPPTQSALASLDQATSWLNSDPLTARGLLGRTVAVDFCTYSCVNWLRTLPYRRAWYERYSTDGLVVVGVHAPEFGFEHDLDNVRRAISELGVPYPVVIDNDFAIWQAFANRYWPALYLVDGGGRLRFHHFGEGAYDSIERAIQQQLGVEGELSEVDAGGVAAAADWDAVSSPETYLGYARGDTPRSDAHVDRLELNQWTLDGGWTQGHEAAVSTRPGARSRFASTRATSTWCSRRPPRARRSASRSASTGGHRATRTGSTSTRTAAACSPSRGCTS